MRYARKEGELQVWLDNPFDEREARLVELIVRTRPRAHRVMVDVRAVQDFTRPALARLARTTRGLSGTSLELRGIDLPHACALQECLEPG
jgi:hypothetical protein